MPNEGKRKLFTGLSAFLKTVNLENPKIIGQMLTMSSTLAVPEIIHKVMETATNPHDREVAYEVSRQGELRLVRKLKEVGVVEQDQDISIPWKDYGVYLITGGMGGLGRMFATAIAKGCVTPTLVLTGRSSLNDEMKKEIDHLQALGARVDYQTVDVSQAESVKQLVDWISKHMAHYTALFMQQELFEIILYLRNRQKNSHQYWPRK